MTRRLSAKGKIRNVKTAKNFVTKNDWVWVLDPLDGTKDFIQGTQNYAMHLALNYKQRPYLGVVLIPERGELWIAHEKKVWCERKDNYKISPIFQKNKRS